MNTRTSPLERAVFFAALLLAGFILYHAGRLWMGRRSSAVSAAVAPSQQAVATTSAGEGDESSLVSELPAVKVFSSPETSRRRADEPPAPAPNR